MSSKLPVVSTSPLPPLYERWMAQCLAAPIAGEPDSTCDDCAMCPDPGMPPTDGVFFNPSTKCCTYVPELPNYLVGEILSDESPTHPGGRESIVRRIAAGVGVAPIGLMQNETFKLVFSRTVAGFGQSTTLLCPHYIDEQGGRCGIWKHRESTCATWFCKHERGAVAKEFWNRLQQLLKVTETALAKWCMLELDAGDEAIALLAPLRSGRDGPQMLDAAQVDGSYDAAGYDRMWGPWARREEAFYRACAKRVSVLEWSDVRAICGSDVRVAEHNARRAFEAREARTLPLRLRAGSFWLIALRGDMCRVQSYSFLDPLDLPRPMFDALALFDGRTTAEALVAARALAGDEFTEDAVRKLVDFRILVDAGG